MIALAATTPAAASGLYVGDMGTKGVARAGAFIAAPDTLAALHYNPAALSKLRGFHTEANLSLTNALYTFKRSCPCADPNAQRVPLPGMPGDAPTLDANLERGFTPSENGFGFVPIPFIGAAYGFDWMDLTVATGAYGPSGGAFDYGPRESAGMQPQRYSAVDQFGYEAYFASAVAFSPLPGLRVGAAIQSVRVNIEQHVHTYANTVVTPFAESPDFDIPATFKLDRVFGLNWAVGASWEPIENLAIGASFTGKRSIRTEGEFVTVVPEILKSAGIDSEGTRALFEFNLPPVARWGVQYRERGIGNIEVAGVYEGWSVYDSIVVRPIDIKLTAGSMTMELPKTYIVRKWQDTVSLRIGGELEVLDPWVRLSAGYFYEPSAIPPERVEPNAYDAPKHGVGFGAKSTWHGFSLELGVETIFLSGRTVTNSVVQQAAPVEPPFGTRAWVTTIGNGTYSGTFLILSTALSFSWDGFQAASEPTP